MQQRGRPFFPPRHTSDRKYPSEKFPDFTHLQMAAWVNQLQPQPCLCTLHHCKSQTFLGAPPCPVPWGFSCASDCTDLQRDMGCRPGCWAWRGGWYGKTWRCRCLCWSCAAPGAWSFAFLKSVWRSQASKRAEGCKNTFLLVCSAIKIHSFHTDLLERSYLGWCVRYRRWGWR